MKVNLCKDLSVRPSDTEDRYMIIGNPGAGKSTLAMLLAKAYGCSRPVFKSGLAVGGAGVTSDSQWVSVPGLGAIIDTPGLTDAQKREQCAREITSALKMGHNYRVFIVCRLESGRIVLEDKVTLQMVIESCQHVPDFKYRIIFNKVTQKQIDNITQNEHNKKVFETTLFDGLVLQGSYTWNLRDDKLEDCDGVEAFQNGSMTDTLKTWILSAPKMSINAEVVDDVKVDQYQKQIQDIQARADELSKDKAKLEARFTKLQEDYQQNEQKVHELQDTMDRQRQEHVDALDVMRQDHEDSLQDITSQLNDARAGTKRQLDDAAAMLEQRYAKIRRRDNAERFDFGVGIGECNLCESQCWNRGCEHCNTVVCSDCWQKHKEEDCPHWKVD